LGGFELTTNDEPVTGVDTPRLQSLLAYLVLNSSAPQLRKHIAFLLWPDSTESQAHTNLRHVLYHLRRALPRATEFLQNNKRTLWWRPDSPFALDVTQFEDALTQADQAVQTGDEVAAVAALEQAVTHYGGELLPSCYDECRYGPAIDHAHRLLRQDPLREATYRRLMRLHALTGDRARAVRVYHSATTLLKRELGADPSPATRAVYEALVAEAELGATRAPPLTLAAELPLVGRQEAWQRLLATWQATRRQRAHFLVITGEAGIGKTRLAEELLQWAAGQGITTAQSRSYAAEGRLAYAPVTDWLRTEALSQGRSKLNQSWLAELGRVLPELRDELPDLPLPGPLTERWQRQRFFEALARAILVVGRPMVLIIDDLQWCDQETLEWLHYLLRTRPQERLLIVSTIRSEEVGDNQPLTALLQSLRRAGRLTEIFLRPLGEADATFLARKVTGQQPESNLIRQLVQETEGNPLFVVELARASLGGPGEAPALPETLPAKVQDVIETRLTRLSAPTRRLANLAAVIGREFTYRELAAAAELDHETLVLGLDELWQRRIVREQGAEAYDFSHDKIREVAYGQLSSARRRLLHGRVAQALESIHTPNLDAWSAQLATHYERAGLVEQALYYYRRAAVVAQQVGASQETISHLSRGLTLLDSLPQTRQRAIQKLEMLISLGSAFVAVRGFSAPEVEDTFREAWQLVAVAGIESPARCLPLLWGLHVVHQVRSEFKQAREYADRFLELAQRSQTTEMLSLGHLNLGTVLQQQGTFAAALKQFEHCMARHTPGQPSPFGADLGPDQSVFARCFASHALWYLGYPRQALIRSQEAKVMARELARPYEMAVALTYSAMLRHYQREDELALDEAETARALCAKHGFPYYRAWGTILTGWGTARRGQQQQGVRQMQQGLADLLATGAKARKPYYLGLLAQVWSDVGQIDKGLALLDEALAWVDEQGEAWPKAELLRLKGKMALKKGVGVDTAADCLQQAIEVAHRQEARLLELRATLSLARLQDERGTPVEQTEARQQLGQIYAWFGEGFDVPDLVQTRNWLQTHGGLS
jgi:DNA-binding SARP family transcriptional activator/predicted ATPase